MEDIIQQLARVTQLRANQTNDAARAEAERQRAVLAAARTSKALAGAPFSRPPSPPPPPIPLSMSAERLAVKLRAFRTSLSLDEVVVLDEWLTRAARPS